MAFAADREIYFSNLAWTVVNNEQSMQGCVSVANVFVDSEQQLHLRFKKRKGKWCGAHLMTKAAFGFGQYRIQLLAQPEVWDPDLRFSFFQAPQPLAKDKDEKMIALEFFNLSKGETFVHMRTGFMQQGLDSKESTSSFDLEKNSVHEYEWQPQSIIFKSAYKDKASSPKILLRSWKFSKEEALTYLPHTPLPMHFYLSLAETASAPANGTEVEIIIKLLSYRP